LIFFLSKFLGDVSWHVEDIKATFFPTCMLQFVNRFHLFPILFAHIISERIKLWYTLSWISISESVSTPIVAFLHYTSIW
jgi:hypothetical protein